jgi:hypothetical protein
MWTWIDFFENYIDDKGKSAKITIDEVPSEDE